MARYAGTAKSTVRERGSWNVATNVTMEPPLQSGDGLAVDFNPFRLVVTPDVASANGAVSLFSSRMQRQYQFSEALEITRMWDVEMEKANRFSGRYLVMPPAGGVELFNALNLARSVGFSGLVMIPDTFPMAHGARVAGRIDGERLHLEISGSLTSGEMFAVEILARRIG